MILVLSDGKDSGPISFRQRPVSQADVIDRARREDVMIYAIGMRSRSSQPMPPGIGPGGLQAALLADLPDPGLARVAEETGGGYTEIRFGQDLGAAFARVADELHTQYLLGFAPPKRDGKVHDISVKRQSGRREAAGAQELRRGEIALLGPQRHDRIDASRAARRQPGGTRCQRAACRLRLQPAHTGCSPRCRTTARSGSGRSGPGEPHARRKACHDDEQASSEHESYEIAGLGAER